MKTTPPKLTTLKTTTEVKTTTVKTTMVKHNNILGVFHEAFLETFQEERHHMRDTAKLASILTQSQCQ